MRSSSSRLMRQGTWSGKAKLVSLEEEYDDTTCAKIELELASEGDLAAGPDGEQREGFEGDFALELEGALYFSLEEGRPVALELEGSLDTRQVMERSRGDMSMRMETERAGEIELSVVLTAVAKD